MLNSLNIGGGTVVTCTEINNKLYLGGTFTSINNQERNYLAEIDLSNGQLTDWNPEIDSNVYKLENAGGKLAMIGAFTSINQASIPHLTIVDVNLKTFENTTSIHSIVQDESAIPAASTPYLDVKYHQNSDTLYVCGGYTVDTSVGKKTTLMSFKGVSSGTSIITSAEYSPIPVDPNWSSFKSNSISIDQVNDVLYSSKGIQDNNVGVSFNISDPDSVSPFTWKPRFTYPINYLFYASGIVYANGAYVGGTYSPTNSSTSRGIVPTNSTTGALDTSADVSLSKGAFNGDTHVLDIHRHGDLLYAFGSFSHAQVQGGYSRVIPRTSVAVFDVNTDEVIGEPIDFQKWININYITTFMSLQPQFIRCAFFHQDRIHLFGDFSQVDGQKIETPGHYIMQANGKRIQKKFSFLNI